MFFDELEALAGKRQYTREATSSKLVSQFLSEMDGFVKNNAGVLILAATNVPWAIDPAFRRPGRFDRVLFVPPPDRAARASILQILLAGRPAAAGIDLDALAARTSRFSGADLENLVDTAADRAIAASLDQNAEVPIDQSHLLGALDRDQADHRRVADHGAQLRALRQRGRPVRRGARLPEEVRQMTEPGRGSSKRRPVRGEPITEPGRGSGKRRPVRGEPITEPGRGSGKRRPVRGER